MNAISTEVQQGNPANPFGTSAVATRSTNNAIADSSQQREISEVQGAMVIAKRFPRSPIEAMDKILQAFTRPSLAEGALYSYSKGGSDVTGPSIRTAEVLAQVWGNIQFGIRELEQRNGESTVEAFAWDIESNTRQVKVFQVRHVRFSRQGAKKLEDPRDIYELVANQGARRLRACILGVIPGDVTEAAVKQAEETLKVHADTTPEAQVKLVAAFEAFGVTKAQIEKKIQCRLEAIRPAQIVQMKKIYASLRDGMSAPAEWFEFEEGGTPAPVTSLKDKVKARTTQTTAEPEAPVLTIAGIKARFESAANRDELDDAYDSVRMFESQDDRASLTAAYEARLAEIEQ